MSKVYLGTVDIREGEVVAISAPPNASAAEIAKAIEQANEAQRRETQRLRELFLRKDKPQ
jgi:hypothetical protein